MMNQLEAYKNKRDFSKTPEPQGLTGQKQNGMVYAVQKHHAKTLHYDLRLEMSGVLKSWAIPKGPSADPSQKKLAIPTEDHPLDYAHFEGIIPPGQYGAGTVILWDRGTYKNHKDDISLQQALKQGKLEIFIDGQKLKGSYVLLRTGKENDPKPRWLFIKMKDDYADASANLTQTHPQSVLSGKTIEELEEENS